MRKWKGFTLYSFFKLFLEFPLRIFKVSKFLLTRNLFDERNTDLHHNNLFLKHIFGFTRLSINLKALEDHFLTASFLLSCTAAFLVIFYPIILRIFTYTYLYICYSMERLMLCNALKTQRKVFVNRT